MINYFKAKYKLLLSYKKKEWSIEDYPVRYRKQHVEHFPDNSRYKMYPWSAQIVNWWSMCGDGDTREEALSALSIKLNEYRERKGYTPRPGTKVALEFASVEEISELEEIEIDFFNKILDSDVHGVFTSDESSLFHFMWSESDNEFENELIQINEKVKNQYGIDISDITDGNLVKIYKRIKERQNESE